MTRDGRRVTEITHDNVPDLYYPLRGRANGRYLTWTEGGTYFRDKEPHPLDLVADADPLPATPDADGWVKHDGGPCPVPPETMVEVQSTIGLTPPAMRADYWQWSAMKRYRIIAPAHAPGPVRERTVKEIVLGVYGRVALGGHLDRKAQVSLTDRNMQRIDDWSWFTAAELRAAASTFTQIADAMEDKP